MPKWKKPKPKEVDDYQERVKVTLERLGPELNLLPDNVRAMVVDRVRQEAQSQQGPRSRIRDMAVGGAKALAGAGIGMARTLGGVGIGTTEESTAMPHDFAADVDPLQRAEDWRSKQSEYESQDADRDAYSTLKNAQHAAGNLWQGIVDMPTIIANAERRGEAFQTGEAIGEAIVRDAAFVAHDPATALHRDPTRALDVAPLGAAAGHAAHAVKAAAKTKGLAKTAKAAGVVGEFLSPSSDLSRTVSRSDNVVDTDAAARTVEAQGQRVLKGDLDPSKAAQDARRAGATRPDIADIGAPEGSELSRAERTAQTAGRSVRGGILFGALASDAIGPVGALVTGAALPLGAKAMGPIARKAVAAYTKRKHDISISDAEAGAEMRRQIVDPDYQQNAATQEGVRDVTRTPIHGRQALETMAEPVASAIEQGKLRLRQVNPEDPSSFTESPITYAHRQVRDGVIEANAESADMAREAYTGAAVKQRKAIAVGEEAKLAGERFKHALAPLEEEAAKEARNIRSKERARILADREAAGAAVAVAAMDPSKQAIAADRALAASERYSSELKAATRADREARLLAKKAGQKPQPALSSRVDALRAAEATTAADRRAIAKIEEVAKKAGPESEELVSEARSAMRQAIDAKKKLDYMMANVGAPERARFRSLLAKIERATEKAAVSERFSRLADREIAAAKSAAMAWVEGAEVTPEVMVGLALIRREAVKTGQTISDINAALGGLDKSRSKARWSLRGAEQEIKARSNAKKLDAAFDRALVNLVELEELKANAKARSVRLLESKMEAESLLDVIPGKERRAGMKAAEADARLVDASRQIERAGQDAESVLRAEQAATAARKASTESRRGPDGKARRLEAEEAEYVQASATLRRAGALTMALTAELEEMVGSPAYKEAVESAAKNVHRRDAKAAAKKSARDAKKTLSGKAGDEGPTPLEVSGRRTFATVDESDDIAGLAEVTVAMSNMLSEMPDLDAKLVIARSLNKASMMHAMNPRVIGHLSSQFLDEMVASGASIDDLMKTEAFKQTQTRFDRMNPLKPKRAQAEEFVRRTLEQSIVRQMNETDLLTGYEYHVAIELPDGRIFDVGERIGKAFDDLEIEGVKPNELMADTARIAFGKLARTYMERKTQIAMANEAFRSADFAPDATGMIPPPVSQLSSIVINHRNGAPSTILPFNAAPGAGGLQEAIAGSFETVAADALAKYGEVITREQFEAAKLDLQNNYIKAPLSARNTLASGLAEHGIGLSGDTDVYMRFGYAQSVGTHLDYLASLEAVSSAFATFLKMMKRGVTVGSFGSMAMNGISNVVLLSIMTGESVPSVLNDLRNEASMLREFEINGRRGVGSEEGRITQLLLETGIGDSSMAKEFSSVRLSTGGTKGTAARAWDAWWNVHVGAYKQVDSIAKMALSRKHLRGVLDDVQSLREGEWMSLDQGGGSRALVYKDEVGTLRLNGKPASWEEIERVSAKQAIKAAADTMFDFNDTGLLLKSLTKNPVGGAFNELGAWFLKAIEMPGRRGIVGSAVLFDPSASYATNSSRLLAKKAAKFAELGLRRHVLNTSARTLADLSGNQTASEKLGFGPGSTLSISPNDNETGRDINVSDMTSSNWMLPMLKQAESAAMLAGHVADLFSMVSGEYDSMKEEELAVMAASELGGRRFGDYRGLSEKERNKAVLVDRRIRRAKEIATGERDLTSSLLEIIQLTGGLYKPFTNATDESFESKVLPRLIGAVVGNSVASLLPFKMDKGNEDAQNISEMTIGHEDYLRYAMSGMFRLVGREMNSQQAINRSLRREKAAVRKWFSARAHGADKLEMDLRRQFIEAMLEDEADKAIYEIEKATQ